MSTTRTFIALAMNEDQQRHLTRVMHQVALELPSLNWVNPTSIHLTLAFLGELDDARLAEAMQATAVSVPQVKPFQYRLTRIGIFGSLRQPRVVWMGIEEPSGSLMRLYHILDQELQQRGFVTDERPFSPHLTLARVKSPLPSEELQHLQRILSDDQRDFVTMDVYRVQGVNVMKSELLRTGAEYTCLQVYAWASD